MQKGGFWSLHASARYLPGRQRPRGGRAKAAKQSPLLSFLVFLFLLFGTFELAFGLGGILSSYLVFLFALLGSAAAPLFPSPLAASFLRDGLLGGVGTVVAFLPPVFFFFLGTSFLEASGYMARAARLKYFFGLPGEAFFPLFLGLGCNVPAVMAAGKISSRATRFATILVIPFISCTARLPTYALLANLFFPRLEVPVIFSLYLLGGLLAFSLARCFQKILPAGKAPPSPTSSPLRFPSPKSFFLASWQRTAAFLRRAGTVIFAASLLTWCLASLPPGTSYAGPGSFIWRLGTLFAPLFAPAGFGKPEAAVALILGLATKEAIVSTLGVLYGGATALACSWTPLSAYAFMVMVLTYAPCAATLAAIRQETGSRILTAFAFIYPLFLGWLLAVLTYRAGTLLGLK